MNYAASSQRARWQLTPERLSDIRKDLRAKSLESIKKAATESCEYYKGKLHAVKLDEAAKLLKFYATKIQDARGHFRLPRKVTGAAIMYLQRLYLEFSVLDRDPVDLFISCIYLACKVEEHYMSAEALAKGFGQADEQDVLGNESTLLIALRFDLITYPPYRPLEGFLQDLADAQPAGDAANGVGGSHAPPVRVSPEQLQQARQHAMEAADVLLLTDAPLLFPPAQLALSALRSGLRKVGISFTPYLEHVAQRVSDPGSLPHGQLPADYLKAQLEKIDSHGVEGSAEIDKKELKRIDRKLKQCRNWAVDPKSEAFQASQALGQQQQAAQRANKLADRKRRQEQREAEVLGWAGPGQPPSAPAAVDPPSKRPRTQA